MLWRFYPNFVKHMKKVLIALLLCVGVQGAYAQDIYNSSGKKGSPKKKDLKPKGFDMSRLVIGGAANLNFGTGFASVGISPMVGYKITDNFAAGVGVSYQYYRNRYEWIDLYSNNNYIGSTQFDRKTSIYSANLWARYIVWKNIFVHVQPELMNIGVVTNLEQDPATLALTANEERKNVFIGLVGAGVRQPITGSLSLYFMLLFDVVQNPYSPYYKRLFDPRIGFNIGF
jgi:hypothetical protein